MNFSDNMRQIIKKNTLEYIQLNNIPESEYATTPSAIIFSTTHDGTGNPNFLKSSLNNIHSNSEWVERLFKTHSHFNNGVVEMASSNSSDALLMNIFCHPDFPSWKGPKKKLGFDDAYPVFGWNPEIEQHNHPTEIDMLLGDTIYEAKLTEKDFTTKNRDTIEAVYPEMDNLIDLEFLSQDEFVKHYQLLRNVYAAYKRDKKFTLLIDARRPDLIQAFVEVLKALKHDDLRRKCGFITWQEIKETVGSELRNFLFLKYGI